MFYCPQCSGGEWRLQQINCGKNSTCATRNPDAVTDGPAADDGPFVYTYSEFVGTPPEQHFAYKAKDGGIWDAYYSGHKWRLQQVNNTGSGGLTQGPAAAAAPFVNVYFGHNQQHFAYRTADGSIWDAFFCPKCDGDKWRLQQLQSNPRMMMSTHDLTPNDAPCNAINKIVRGYLQAFDALPGPNERLRELWNSEDDPNDAVEWFAKESPPTIANGKVFVAEFPAKPTGSNWNDNKAFGRLVVYSIR